MSVNLSTASPGLSTVEGVVPDGAQEPPSVLTAATGPAEVINTRRCIVLSLVRHAQVWTTFTAATHTPVQNVFLHGIL
jgi:hypothetical protein